MSNNSLAGLKGQAKSSLPTALKAKRGRTAKPESEKASKPITLKFTQAEYEAISDRAGLVSKATFLKDLLLKNTDLFDVK